MDSRRRAAIWRRRDAGRSCLDGSFVTAKPVPGDYDGAWETEGVDPGRLDPVLLDFRNGRAAMKAKYLGDLFPASALASQECLSATSFKRIATGSRRGSR